MNRRVGAVLAVIMTLLTVSGCHDIRQPGVRSLPLVFGVRVTDGQLKIWTGAPCLGVTRFGLGFDQYDTIALVLTSPTVQGVQVDRITLGGPYPAGLEITKALPAGFDWRSAKSVRVSVNASVAGGGRSADLAEAISGSASHPDDTYWFEEAGWLNPAEVAAKDGKTLLTPCTPDPAKSPK